MCRYNRVAIYLRYIHSSHNCSHVTNQPAGECKSMQNDSSAISFPSAVTEVLPPISLSKPPPMEEAVTGVLPPISLSRPPPMEEAVTEVLPSISRWRWTATDGGGRR